MSIAPEKHRAAVANFMAGKVREFGYQLRLIVEQSDCSISFAIRNKNINGDLIIYAFSAFGNAIQSLKDALKTVGAEPLSWPDIYQLPYGDFICKSRNAMTHDGNPVINAWVDGKYFIANDINRFGSRGEAIQIERPDQDVRTICLAFALAFCSLLTSRLQPMIGGYRISGANLDLDEVQSAIENSHVIPAEVKDLFSKNRREISKNLVQAPSLDPIEKAIDELRTVISYCSLQLELARQP